MPSLSFPRPPWLAIMVHTTDMLLSAMVQDMAPNPLTITATAITRTHGRTQLRTTQRPMATIETHSQPDRKMKQQMLIEKAGTVLISASHHLSSSMCQRCRALRLPRASLEAPDSLVTPFKLPSSRAKLLSSREISVIATILTSPLVVVTNHTHLR